MTCSQEFLPPSYAECHGVARRAASSFYPCFFLLRRPRRRAMEALYAFMRYTDDLADGEGVKDRAAALREWRGGLEAAIAGKIVRPASPAQRILVAVADTAERFQIPHRHLFDVIGGVEMDLNRRRYATFAELVRYCDLVAGAVGLACIRIWGFCGEEPVEPARACGLAFQMTNILRDLREDAQRGRVYLPEEDLARFGYTEADLAAGVADERFMQLMRRQIERTEMLYTRALPLAPRLEPEGRRMFLMMVQVYHRLFKMIRTDPARVLSQRVTLSLVEKLAIILRAIAGPAEGALR
ncbi:MAG: phytoene/squalene synthase family protein [Thermoguttaceae bacterium]|jgi:phytoene synthase